eukprot:jgi/Mesvir1/13287/Mv16552-RA.1
MGEASARFYYGRMDKRNYPILLELNRILDEDPLIDEVELVPSTSTLLPPADQEAAGTPYVKTIFPLHFFCIEHKLAICIKSASAIAATARDILFAELPRFRVLTDASKDTCGWTESKILDKGGLGVPATSQDRTPEPEFGDVPVGSSAPHDITKDVLQRVAMASRALLLFNGGHGTAWNARKRLLLAGATTCSYELALSALVTRKWPKSLEAWAHRRWLLRRILEEAGGDAAAGARNHESSGQSLGQFGEFGQEARRALLAEESNLCFQVARRHKMRYSAWHHRGWMATRMAPRQVAEELQQLHGSQLAAFVDDNCAFHYSQFLLSLLARHVIQAPVADSSRTGGEATLAQAACAQELNESASFRSAVPDVPHKEAPVHCSGSSLLSLRGLKGFVKEATCMSRELILVHPGREALWGYLRFLSHLYLIYPQLREAQHTTDTVDHDAAAPPLPALSPGSALHALPGPVGSSVMWGGREGDGAPTELLLEELAWVLHDVLGISQGVGPGWPDLAHLAPVQDDLQGKRSAQQRLALSHVAWLLYARCHGRSGRRQGLSDDGASDTSQERDYVDGSDQSGTGQADLCAWSLDELGRLHGWMGALWQGLKSGSD